VSPNRKILTMVMAILKVRQVSASVTTNLCFGVTRNSRLNLTPREIPKIQNEKPPNKPS
jgi:hypothetical protein